MTQDLPFATPTAGPAPQLRWLIWARLLGALGATLLVAAGALTLPWLPLAPLTLAAGALLAANLTLFAFLRSPRAALLDERMQRRLIGGQVALDLVMLTVLLAFGGGAESPYYPFYVFPVILAAALLPEWAAFGAAGLASLLYAGLMLLERFGQIPYHSPLPIGSVSPYQNGTVLLAQGFAVALTCVITSAVTARLVTALRGRAGQLAESNRRAEVRAEHMQELNDQLRAANEDCKHQREHLDAAYSELRQAYTRTEVRSARMSELNEQLRSANAECKARREELERVNQELARANIKLRELEDIRAQFTLLVTHELRAPVAAIQSYLRLILDGYVPEAKLRDTLVKAERRAMEQLALIADLLELRRISSADARGSVEPLQVGASLREQADLLVVSANERNITLQVDAAADLPLVLANPDQIKSLWNNLISNAIKYNRDGGRVEVTLEHAGERLVARVSDTGIGIPPEAMARLFSEFFRADNAKSSGRPGTGLGLSIVKEIVERTGGQITVESEVGQGTTFRFWLPAIPEPAKPKPPPVVRKSAGKR